MREDKKIYKKKILVMQKGEELGKKALEVADFSALPGNGLTAVLSGKTLVGGSLSFIGSKTEIPKELQEQAEVLSEQGKTPLVFMENEQLAGIIAVADTIKADSPKAVKELRDMGIKVIMLTGDNERTAKAIGRQAGVDEVIAGVLPDGKESVIRSLKQQGKVAMVGDGINDAPVLAGADVGAAMGSGADAAIEAADVVFMNSNMDAIPQAIALANKTGAVAMQNVIFAIGIKVIVMILGLTGIYTNMWLAVFADTGVAFLCILNSIRILRQK